MSSLAQIKQKMVFNVPVETMSPLRIASGMDDGLTDILILKNKAGQALVPGTSLAGVLRAAIAGIYNEAVAAKIFGSVEDNGNQSMINIGDIILSDSQLLHRDGVAIDTFCGVGVKGAKYDYEAIDRGARGDLVIELTVRENDLQNAPNVALVHKNITNLYSDVAATIADLLTAGIHLGSLTAKGYGRLAGKKNAGYLLFDFSTADGAKDWLAYLDNNYNGKPAYIGDAEAIATSSEEDFIMEADFALQSFLIVRDFEEAAERSNKDEKLAAVQLKSGRDFVIPGTSVKGVIRNRCTKIMTYLCGEAKNKVNEFINPLMGYANDKTGAALKSRLLVDEIYIAKSDAKPMKHSRNRINRFTGGTEDGALFTEEVIRQENKDNAAVKMCLRVSKCSQAEAGLLLLVLKDFWLGKLSLGGGKSIGRGTLTGKACIINYKGKKISLNAKGYVEDAEARNFLEDCVQELVVKCNG